MGGRGLESIRVNLWHGIGIKLVTIGLVLIQISSIQCFCGCAAKQLLFPVLLSGQAKAIPSVLVEPRQLSECCGTQPQHPRQLTTFTTAAASATQPTRSDNVLTIS